MNKFEIFLVCGIGIMSLITISFIGYVVAQLVRHCIDEWKLTVDRVGELARLAISVHQPYYGPHNTLSSHMTRQELTGLRRWVLTWWISKTNMRVTHYAGASNDFRLEINVWGTRRWMPIKIVNIENENLIEMHYNQIAHEWTRAQDSFDRSLRELRRERQPDDNHIEVSAHDITEIIAKRAEEIAKRLHSQGDASRTHTSV